MDIKTSQKKGSFHLLSETDSFSMQRHERLPAATRNPSSTAIFCCAHQSRHVISVLPRGHGPFNILGGGYPLQLRIILFGYSNMRSRGPY